MKKLFLSLMLLVASVTGMLAQSSHLVATLNHNDTISAYYGVNALKQAHTAAVDGDIITLSSGAFAATNITKSITLRGAGMLPDTVAKTTPTVIRGDFSIGESGSYLFGLTIEDIYHNHKISLVGYVQDAQFVRSRLKEIYCTTSQVFIESSFLHCRIVDKMTLDNSSASFVNCVVNAPNCSSNASLDFRNCIVKFEYKISNYELANMYNASFVNSILYQSMWAGYYHKLNSSCIAYNCVCPDAVKRYNLFANMTNNTNKYTESSAAIFKSYTGGDLLDYQDFELVDSANTAFLGADGTQVGIHGGDFPYNPIPNIPQITKFEVGKRSTEDGKLNVNIEVKSVATEPEK